MITLTATSHEIVGDTNLFKSRLELLNNSVCLEKIEERLMRLHFWEKDEAAEVRKDFIRFSALTFVAPALQLVPTRKIDEFWHAFIIYTQMYKEWCDKNWGEGTFFHHVPGHLGDASWEKTKVLAKQIYGVDWHDSAQALSCGCAIPNPRPAAVPKITA